MATHINPTVGRVVWFFTGAPEQEQPQAAIIAYVHGPSMVNLSVIEPDGTFTPRTSVPLVQEDEVVALGQMYCSWMPFQIGQAARYRGEEDVTTG